MINAVFLLQRLHCHRAWVNQNLLAAASGLTGEQLNRQFPIGQGSIWKSLVHLYAGEFVWLEALLGNDDPVVRGDLPRQIPGNQLGQGGIATLDELKREWTALEERWQRYLADLSPVALEQPVHKWSSAAGQSRRYATSRTDVLLHVCTHAQYTTAQAVNMLRHAGVEKLPDTMLITLARQETVENGVSATVK
jgi:uncharacterized damage-inducible protein DinB